MKVSSVLLMGLVLFAGCVSDEGFAGNVSTNTSEAALGGNWTLCDEDNRPEVCTREYMPVCGDDNETYSNACIACSDDAVAAHRPGSCEDLASDDLCGAQSLQGVIGDPVSTLDEGVVADARVIRPGDAVTMDYRPDRLNIYLDLQDVVERVTCG